MADNVLFLVLADVGIVQNVEELRCPIGDAHRVATCGHVVWGYGQQGPVNHDQIVVRVVQVR